MLRFFTGDESGYIKATTCFLDGPKGEPLRIDTAPIAQGGNSRGIQRLSLTQNQDGTLLAAARADGSLSAFNCGESSADLIKEWNEPKFNATKDHRFIGLKVTPRGLYSCTSFGHFRLTPLEEGSPSGIASLPIRLCDLQHSADGKTFAYGGDEVDLSVWDIEKALSSPVPPPPQPDPVAGQKRKKSRSPELMHGEIWRAKNVPNDNLSLRQPIHITSLTYLEPHLSNHHLLTGTRFGSIRRYDIRTARRPVSDWSSIGKVGGIKTVEGGLREHEVFVSDHGANLYALDLRNGRTIYGYKGIAGAITGISPASPSYLASVSLDRYFRFHSTFPPPEEAGQAQIKKGEVLGKLYMKSIPTTILWDGKDVGGTPSKNLSDDEDKDVWEGMQDVGDSDQEDHTDKRHHKKAKNG